ncbi:MAG: hypothetical protein ACK559_31760, partial [bacterium]
MRFICSYLRRVVHRVGGRVVHAVSVYLAANGRARPVRPSTILQLRLEEALELVWRAALVIVRRGEDLVLDFDEVRVRLHRAQERFHVLQ